MKERQRPRSLASMSPLVNLSPTWFCNIMKSVFTFSLIVTIDKIFTDLCINSLLNFLYVIIIDFISSLCVMIYFILLDNISPDYDTNVDFCISVIFVLYFFKISIEWS